MRDMEMMAEQRHVELRTWQHPNISLKERELVSGVKIHTKIARNRAENVLL